MQLVPQHASEAPPQVVGVTHVPALHTKVPAQGSAPGQHGVFMEPQGPGPASTAVAPRQKPPMHVSPVVHDGPIVQHIWSVPPQVTAASWQVPPRQA